MIAEEGKRILSVVLSIVLAAGSSQVALDTRLRAQRQPRIPGIRRLRLRWPRVSCKAWWPPLLYIRTNLSLRSWQLQRFQIR